MKPFMYYVINKYKIEMYLTVEMNGNDPHLTKSDLLKPYIKKFIENYPSGVDKNIISEYVDYICSHISHAHY